MSTTTTFIMLIKRLLLIVFFPLVLLQWSYRLFAQAIHFLSVCIQEHQAEKELQIQLQYELKHCVQSYSEYREKALELDRLTGMDIWKRCNDDLIYDYEQVENRLFHLRAFMYRHAPPSDVAPNSSSSYQQQVLQHQAAETIPSPMSAIRDKSSVRDMLMQLRSLSHRNIFGICHPQLFSCQIGTKSLIEEFIDEYCKVLKFIAQTDFGAEVLSELDKFQFFKETTLAIGRTALMLSGGASLGMYHFGVLKSLYEQNLLPKIISGSSAGAIVAAMFCCKADSDLHQLFEQKYFKLEAFENLDQRKSPIRKFLRFLKSGVFMDSSRLENCLRENIGDLTFAEAYEISGRILNITVNSSKGFTMPSLLNYISAPNVLIWSAAVCSCAVPGVFSPGRLMGKDELGNIVPYHPSGVKFCDGTFWADLPQTRLSEMFHVNFTICSQVNPHVIPFLSDDDSQSGVAYAGKMFLLGELKYRVQQLYQHGMVPKCFNWFEAIVCQNYTGDVTILPAGPVTLEVLSKLLKNPSWEFIDQCIQIGQRRTWPKTSIIRTKCKIEMALDECIEIVQQKILAQMKVNNLDYTNFRHVEYLFRSLPVSNTIKSILNERHQEQKQQLEREQEHTRIIVEKVIIDHEEHERTIYSS